MLLYYLAKYAVRLHEHAHTLRSVHSPVSFSLFAAQKTQLASYCERK